MERGEGGLPEQELARSAAVLAQRFIQRWNVYPQQLEDGRYVCIHEPLNVSHLYAHLRGEITLGTYLLNRESKVRFVVLDNDSETGWEYLLTCGSKLANANIPAYIERSRRGGHIWIFFEKPIEGSLARAFSETVAKKYRFEGFEIYPKQDTVGQGFGSLIRLPFGVHRLTGKRYGFYRSNGEPLGSTLREQLYALQRPDFVSAAMLEPYKIISSSETPKALPKRLSKTTEHISERLKARVTVLEFISQYVDLKPNESGAIGLCPFHDDQHPSFGVNDKENYWHCFAGCGGGSIIDFWSMWRKKQGLDAGFIPTITELAEMLF
ncbi:MAG: CHC2 zinc finger domain-containing protein [Anaerolineales bacterium]